MKFFRQIVVFLAFILGTFNLTAQEISQRTLYNMLPLAVNPAYTGDFEGSFRIGGIYKSYQSNTYRTPSLFVDVPIIMIRKRDWVSAGLSFDADRAGDTNFGTTRSAISASYHLALDKKGKSYFVAGFQFGSDKFKLDKTKATLGDNNDTNFQNLPDDASSSFQNFGVMYRSQVDKNTDISIGAAYLYIVKQSGSFTNNNNSPKRPSEIVLHGKMNRNIDKKQSVHPSFLIKSRGYEGTEVMVQLEYGYLYKEDVNLRLIGGLGYDLNQGPALILGADYGDWRIRGSYEFPLYGVKEALENIGGFEISASRIINVYKKPIVEPAICCPDL